MTYRAPGRRLAIPLAAGAVVAVVLGTVIGVTLLNNRPEDPPTRRSPGGTPGVEGVGSVELGGCRLFPDDNYWHADVSGLPVHPMSDRYLDTIGREVGLHADFGAGLFKGEPIGIPYVVVEADQPEIPVTFEFADESDPGPYPIPMNAPIEGGPASEGDRHVLVIERDSCSLYELYAAYPQDDGSWAAGSGAVFDLSSNDLRPESWTSADASMGLWLRMRADFDISRFPDELQVILKAMQVHGLILADNGSSMILSGVPETVGTTTLSPSSAR